MLLTTPSRPPTVRVGSFDRSTDVCPARQPRLRQRQPTTARRLPNVAATWNDGTYVLTVDVPGVPEEALRVGHRAHAGPRRGTDDLTWNQRIRLPQTLDVEATTANYANGRLTVTVPAAPRRSRARSRSPSALRPWPSSLRHDQPADSATNDTE